jgi:hypothetical protein
MKQIEDFIVFHIVQPPADHLFHVAVITPQQTDFMRKGKIPLIKLLHLRFELNMFLPKLVVDKKAVGTPDHPVKQRRIQDAESRDQEHFPKHVAPQSL